MILGTSELVKLVENGTITYSKDILKFMEKNEDTPFDCNQIGPASIDLRLGNSFVKFSRDQIITLGGQITYKKIYVKPNEPFWLNPGEFVLASTMEYIKVPEDLAAFIHGRSSVGRAGLNIQNAGYIDPGFEGTITLELKNETSSRIKLIPGYPVAQIVFERCAGVVKPYNGKYTKQINATPTRMYADAEKYRIFESNQIEKTSNS